MSNILRHDSDVLCHCRRRPKRQGDLIVVHDDDGGSLDVDADPWVVHLHRDRQRLLVLEQIVVKEGQVVAHSLLVDGSKRVELEGLGEALVVCTTYKYR